MRDKDLGKNALPSKILFAEDRIEERSLFKKRSIRVDEINYPYAGTNRNRRLCY